MIFPPNVTGITVYPSKNCWQVSVRLKGNDGWVCYFGPTIFAALQEAFPAPKDDGQDLV